MKPYTRTIIELFDGKKRYLIPLYQRQYAWKVDPQLELLWADITRAADKLETGGGKLTPHFMGAMVISLVITFGKQVQAYEVIDGQQRLTTFQLLLAAVRKVAQEFGSDYADEIKSYLLNTGVMEDPKTECFKIWPSRVDRKAFTRIIAPSDVEAKTDETDTAVLPAVAAFEYFVAQTRQRVSPKGELDTFKLEKLFEALKSGLAVVSIELEGGDDPQTIFETLNSRGVDLSAGDLMRNFIFQRAVGLGQEDGSLVADALYEKYWLPLDDWFWREGETRGRLKKNRLDWGLVDHLAMKKADLVSAEALFETYRSWIIEKPRYPNIKAELQGIKASADILRRIVEKDKNNPIGRFGLFSRAFDVNTTSPLVIYLATEAEIGDRLAEALHLIESYIVRRSICGLTTANYNRFFVDIVGKLRGDTGDKVEHLLSLLSAGANDSVRWPEDQEYQTAWHGKPQYKGNSQPRLRYILEAIENEKRTTDSEVVEIKSDLTVEHIMPQKWRNNWSLGPAQNSGEPNFDIELFKKEQARDEHVNRMGNLTLLTQPLNSSIKDSAFHVKMPALRAQSALVLNRELYNYNTWDEASIVNRGLKLFGYAKSLWRGPDLSAMSMPATMLQTADN